MSMAVNFVERSENNNKISRETEISTWETAMAAINNLVARCNAANGTSISPITLVTQATTGTGLMSADDYDNNITAIQNALNAIIVASSAQGLNPSNLINLFKRSGQAYPLLIWQRDSNIKTIQTAINVISDVYLWAGA